MLREKPWKSFLFTDSDGKIPEILEKVCISSIYIDMVRALYKIFVKNDKFPVDKWLRME